MSTDSNDEVNVLQLSIHGVLVGYVAGFKNQEGRVFDFTDPLILGLLSLLFIQNFG